LSTSYVWQRLRPWLSLSSTYTPTLVEQWPTAPRWVFEQTIGRVLGWFWWNFHYRPQLVALLRPAVDRYIEKRNRRIRMGDLKGRREP